MQYWATKGWYESPNLLVLTFLKFINVGILGVQTRKMMQRADKRIKKSHITLEA